MDEFYIGYLPTSPPRTARRIRAAIMVLILAACVLAAELVVNQASFPAASFEFDHERAFKGVVIGRALPVLQLSEGSSAVLVAPGKHGYMWPPGVSLGTSVAFRGKLIQRRESQLIEVASPIEITAEGKARTASPMTPIQVSGEVVDTKCFGGVMNPGFGKVHRACAARCLHGGIPPALLTETGALYYLMDSAGEPLSAAWISTHAGERITVQGDLLITSGTRIVAMKTAVLTP
jgi:hypothetical protein